MKPFSISLLFNLLAMCASFAQVCPPKIEWQQSFGGTGSDEGWGLLQLADGGYILAASSDSDPSGDKTSPHFGDTDLWVVRFDPVGNILWDKSFGGSGKEYQANIIPAGESGFLLGGTSFSGPDGNKTSPVSGGRLLWLVRLDADGNKVWERSYDTHGQGLIGLSPTTDGGSVLTSFFYSDPNEFGFGGMDSSIVRLNAAGDVIWARDFGGSGDDMALDI